MTYAPFFLTGAPKSGTTWLGRLLDAHPEISCRGEACVHHFGLRLVESAKSYNELLVKRRQAITDSNDFPAMPWSDVLVLMRRFVQLRLEAIADPAKPKLRFLGEKDPEHALHMKTLGELFPEAKVLHILRDGRAVFVSAWHHNVRSKDPNLATHGFDDFLDITAREWSDRVRRGRGGAQILGPRYFELRYEDLLQQPETWAAKVFAFIGASADSEVVRHCVDAASFEKLSQGRKRGEGDANSFFRKGLADDWKQELSAAQTQRFGQLSGGLLGELGYEV